MDYLNTIYCELQNSNVMCNNIVLMGELQEILMIIFPEYDLDCVIHHN